MFSPGFRHFFEKALNGEIDSVDDYEGIMYVWGFETNPENGGMDVTKYELIFEGDKMVAIKPYVRAEDKKSVTLGNIKGGDDSSDNDRKRRYQIIKAHRTRSVEHRLSFQNDNQNRKEIINRRKAIINWR